MRTSESIIPAFVMRAALAATVTAAVVAAPAAAAPEVKRPTLAILYFNYQGQDPELGQLQLGLAQTLIADLWHLEGWQIVERERLEALLAEHDLSRQGLVDPATAVRIGKLLGARYMVFGGYFDLNEVLYVNARLVDVKTGSVVGATRAVGAPGDFLGVEQKIAQDLERLLVERTEEARASMSTPVAAPPRRDPVRIKHPSRLKTKTALAYSKGLALLDKGDKVGARAQLQQVVKEQPDFVLASADLDRLMQ